MVILKSLRHQAIDEISGNLAPIMDRKQDINIRFQCFSNIQEIIAPEAIESNKRDVVK